MPVYLFTYHAYLSWMPDHPRGYTKRGVGPMLPDEAMGRNYERKAACAPTVLDIVVQTAIVEHVRRIPDFIPIRFYAITTEPSHIHVLCGWDDDRSFESVRNSVKTSISRRLAELSAGGEPLRLSRGASRSHVDEQDHFDHLMFEYLPKHSGASWFEDRGTIPARREAWEKRPKRDGP